jgi:hypothetical protein
MSHIKIIKPGICRVNKYQGECKSCGCIVEADKQIVNSSENIYSYCGTLSSSDVCIRCPTPGCEGILKLYPMPY